MEWLVIGGMVCVCYAIFKLLIFLLEEKVVGEPSKLQRNIVAWVVIIIVFGCGYLYNDNRSIKDNKEYYVNMFESLNSAKNYRVPGLIYTDEDGYHLYQITWTNGGYTTFENSGFYEDLIIGEKVELKDDEGKTWYAELTRERVK